MRSVTQWDAWMKRTQVTLLISCDYYFQKKFGSMSLHISGKSIKSIHAHFKKMVRHLWNDVSSCFISDCRLPDSRGAVNHGPILVGAPSFIWNALEGSLDHEIILISSKWCCGGDSLLPHLELYDVNEHGHRETDVVSSGEGTPRGNRSSSPRVYHWSHL